MAKLLFAQVMRMFRGVGKDKVEVETKPLVLCENCKHRPTQTEPPKTYGFSIEFPEDSKCPCQCADGWYSWYPADDWFCANGEEREKE